MYQKSIVFGCLIIVVLLEHMTWLLLTYSTKHLVVLTHLLVWSMAISTKAQFSPICWDTTCDKLSDLLQVSQWLYLSTLFMSTDISTCICQDIIEIVFKLALNSPIILIQVHVLFDWHIFKKIIKAKEIKSVFPQTFFKKNRVGR